MRLKRQEVTDWAKSFRQKGVPLSVAPFLQEPVWHCAERRQCSNVCDGRYRLMVCLKSKLDQKERSNTLAG